VPAPTPTHIFARRLDGLGPILRLLLDLAQRSTRCRPGKRSPQVPAHLLKLLIPLLHPPTSLLLLSLGLERIFQDGLEILLVLLLVGQDRCFPADPELDTRLLHPKGHLDFRVGLELVVLFHSVVGGGEEEVRGRGQRSVDNVSDLRGLVCGRVGREWVGYGKGG
jgi:hypothetical protein